MTSLRLIFCLIAIALAANLSQADEPRQEAVTGTAGVGIMMGDNTNGTNATLGKAETTVNTIGKNPVKKFAIVGDANIGLMLGAATSKKNGNEVGGGFSGLIRFDALYAPLTGSCTPVAGGGIDYGGSLIGPISNASNDAPLHSNIGIALRASAGGLCAGTSGRAFSLLATGGVGGGSNGNRYLLGLRAKFMINKVIATTGEVNLVNSYNANGTEVLQRELVAGLQLIDPTTHAFMGFDAKVAEDQTKNFTIGKTDSDVATIFSVTGGISF